ncbi:7TM-DISM domain-containing protein [Gemmobacter lanyuensis]
MRLSKSFPGRVIWVAFSLFINLIFLSGQLAAQARDELIERVELLNDSSTQMGIDEVLSKSFRPVESSITLGYTSAAHWLRLRINPDPADGEVILLIRPRCLMMSSCMFPRQPKVRV